MDDALTSIQLLIIDKTIDLMQGLPTELLEFATKFANKPNKFELCKLLFNGQVAEQVAEQVTDPLQAEFNQILKNEKCTTYLKIHIDSKHEKCFKKILQSSLKEYYDKLVLLDYLFYYKL